jgi:hypothetical protein
LPINHTAIMAGPYLAADCLTECHFASNGVEEKAYRARFREAARGGKQAKSKAVVAVARKLAVLLHRLWTTQEPLHALLRGSRLRDADVYPLRRHRVPMTA